eukprot:231605-Amphidinium_carterae.1
MFFLSGFYQHYHLSTGSSHAPCAPTCFANRFWLASAQANAKPSQVAIPAGIGNLVNSVCPFGRDAPLYLEVLTPIVAETLLHTYTIKFQGSRHIRLAVTACIKQCATPWPRSRLPVKVVEVLEWSVVDGGAELQLRLMAGLMLVCVYTRSFWMEVQNAEEIIRDEVDNEHGFSW